MYIDNNYLYVLNGQFHFFLQENIVHNIYILGHVFQDVRALHQRHVLEVGFVQPATEQTL